MFSRVFLLKEKVTPENVFFLLTLIKNLALTLVTRRSLSLLSAGFSLWNSSPKKTKIWHHCRHFELYSAARPRFRDVIPSKTFCPNGFRQAFYLPLWAMAALKPYYFGPNVLQTPKMKAVKIGKWIIAWKKKKNILLTFGISSHKHGLAAKYSSKRRPPNRFFWEEFLQYSRHYSGWNFGGWKSWMFTCYRRRQKSKLFWSDLLL